jgi:tetratricopeptide (TPR) repeat protein
MSRQVRTLVLWVALIILMVALYRVFSIDPQGARAASAESGPPNWLWTWGPFVLLFTFFVAYVKLMQRRYAPTQDGARLLDQGRYAQALKSFEEYRSKHPKEAVSPFNTGVVRLSLWRLEKALEDLEAARRLSGGKDKRLESLLPEHLAVASALLGREADARRALAEIPQGKAHPGRVGLVEGILSLRGGDASAARARLASFEVKRMGGSLGTLARVLDAFCLERLTGELRHVDKVALFGEGGPDELKAAWPELWAFVERAPPW